MLSTDIYAVAVEAAMNTTGSSSNFLKERHGAMSDLDEQVTAFLSRDAAGVKEERRLQEKETIWILSFGATDVPALAALPLAVARAVVARMADHLFA